MTNTGIKNSVVDVMIPFDEWGKMIEGISKAFSKKSSVGEKFQAVGEAFENYLIAAPASIALGHVLVKASPIIQKTIMSGSIGQQSAALAKLASGVGWTTKIVGKGLISTFKPAITFTKFAAKTAAKTAVNTTVSTVKVVAKTGASVIADVAKTAGLPIVGATSYVIGEQVLSEAAKSLGSSSLIVPVIKPYSSYSTSNIDRLGIQNSFERTTAWKVIEDYLGNSEGPKDEISSWNVSNQTPVAYLLAIPRKIQKSLGGK